MFLISDRNLSLSNDLYWRCTSFEKAFRRGRPLNILHDSKGRAVGQGNEGFGRGGFLTLELKTEIMGGVDCDRWGCGCIGSGDKGRKLARS